MLCLFLTSLLFPLSSFCCSPDSSLCLIFSNLEERSSLFLSLLSLCFPDFSNLSADFSDFCLLSLSLLRTLLSFCLSSLSFDFTLSCFSSLCLDFSCFSIFSSFS
uniref:Putative secreted protein n=1 Tax=Panstrongylus lignarius TaxID=156445 RepID=A0A224Y289_9HEMI